MRKLIIGCTGLVAVLLIVGVVVLVSLPNEFEVERSKVVSASPGEAYAVILDLHTWPDWSAWDKETDPDCVWDYNDKSGVGASVDWAGPVHGKGGILVTECVEAAKIEYELTILEGGDELKSKGIIEFTPSGDGTNIRWALHAEFEGLAKFFGLALDPLVGSSFQKGLDNLEAHFSAAN